jgi:hypothetical protein
MYEMWLTEALALVWNVLLWVPHCSILPYFETTHTHFTNSSSHVELKRNRSQWSTVPAAHSEQMWALQCDMDSIFILIIVRESLMMTKSYLSCLRLAIWYSMKWGIRTETNNRSWGNQAISYNQVYALHPWKTRINTSDCKHVKWRDCDHPSYEIS